MTINWFKDLICYGLRNTKSVGEFTKYLSERVTKKRAGVWSVGFDPIDSGAEWLLNCD